MDLKKRQPRCVASSLFLFCSVSQPDIFTQFLSVLRQHTKSVPNLRNMTFWCVMENPCGWTEPQASCVSMLEIFFSLLHDHKSVYPQSIVREQEKTAKCWLSLQVAWVTSVLMIQYQPLTAAQEWSVIALQSFPSMHLEHRLLYLLVFFFFYPPFLLSTLVSRLFKYGKNKKTNNKGENRFGDMLSYSEVKCRSADCTRWWCTTMIRPNPKEPALIKVKRNYRRGLF